MTSRWRRLARSPLVHFLVLGGVLLLLEAAFTGPPPLRVSARDVELLARVHEGRSGLPPSPEQLAADLDAWIDDELAVAEARRLGLHREDLVIHRRLIEKMRVLTGDEEQHEDEDEDVAELVERAFVLGLDRSDPIVRGRLVQRLEQRWSRLDGPLRAAPQELEAYLAANAERYEVPPRARVSHVFLAGTDRRGAARELLAELRAGGVEPERAALRGDSFPLGFHWQLRTESRLQRALSAEAAELAMKAPVGEWSGPVPSAWGQHLLFVHERVEAQLPPASTLRPQLLQALADARREKRLERERRALRARRDVEVELPERWSSLESSLEARDAS